MAVRRTWSVGMGLIVNLLTASALATEAPPLDVPYVPTKPPVVERMLELGEVDENDLLYDLGSGDGRIVITAAKERGAHGVGVDLDPERVEEARSNAEGAGVSDMVEFVEGDLFELDFSDATVVTMYLLPGVNLKLRPRLLKELEPGTRIVSHAFDMGDWQPDQKADVAGARVYMWIVPAQVAGNWQWQVDGKQYALDLEQKFQKISGTVQVDGRPAELSRAELQGDTLQLAIQPEGEADPIEFTAQYRDGGLIGVAPDGDGSQDEQWVAQREEGTPQG